MRKIYLTPQIETLVLSVLQIICDSPAPGTNEQISIEDWSDLINNE